MSRAVPRIFCLWGQTVGANRIQTGFLVKHYFRKKISFAGGGNCPPCPPPAMYGPDESVGSKAWLLYAPSWSLWSRTIDPVPDHPKGQKLVINLSRPLEWHSKHRRCKLYIDIMLRSAETNQHVRVLFIFGSALSTKLCYTNIHLKICHFPDFCQHYLPMTHWFSKFIA